MSVPTNKTSYRKHEYSGPRKSLKRVRSALKKHHIEASRLKAWRSDHTKKKRVKEESSKENSFTPKPLKTYSRVKSKTHIVATNSVPSTLTLKLDPDSSINSDSFQFVNCAHSTSLVRVEPVNSEMLDSLQCVNCGILLKELQKHWVTEESEKLQQLLRDWTLKELGNKDALCVDCYSLLCLALESDDKSRRFGHEEVCLPCGVSLLQNWKSPSLSSHPILKRAIAQWTPSHQVRRLKVVCWKCYQKARCEFEITNSEVPSKVEPQDKKVKTEPLESLLGYSELIISPTSQENQSEEEEIPDKHPQPASISLPTVTL